jgi:spoIIIJ-associated protein
LEELETARVVLSELTKRMGVSPEVEGYLKEGKIYLEIKGDSEGILIGRHGRTLEALEILINRMVNKQIKEPVRIVLDIDHYREKRLSSLVQLADRLSERTKRDGKAITIGPFNAYDRRIIHVALQEDPLVSTESIGEGPMKKISILPKKV